MLYSKTLGAQLGLSRDEKISYIQAKLAGTAEPTTREQKIEFIRKQLEAKRSEGLGSQIVDGLIKTANKIDSYSGAPVRAAIGAAQESENPLSAFANQFGEDNSLAPTGKQLAQKAGVPNNSLSEIMPGIYTDDPKQAEKWFTFLKGGPADISASGVAGLGLEIATDPTMLIPGAAAKKGLDVVGKGVKAGTSVAKAAIKGAANPILDRSADILTKGTVKLGSALTGVPQQNIKTYIEKAPEIKDLLARHDGNIAAAADDLRTNFQESIRKTVSGLNDEIKAAIKSADPSKKGSVEQIVKVLEQVKSGVNSTLYPGSVDEIDGLIAKIKGLSEPDYFSEIMSPAAKKEAMDAISAKAVNEAKRFLQDVGESAYQKNGQVFNYSKQAARAAKSGAAEARKIETSLVPETVGPNKKLSELHNLEDVINPNLIATQKPESALIAAGAGQNPRSVENLKKLGDLTGYDALGEAEKLSAAKVFSNPDLLPMDATGKSFARMAFGTVLGSALGGPWAAPIGLALTSPKALKAAIDGGKISKDLVLKLAKASGDVTDQVLSKAVSAAKTDEGINLIKGAIKALQTERPIPLKAAEQENNGAVHKWIQNGIKKVSKAGSLNTDLDVIKNNPEISKLLVRAADMKEGSEGLKKIVEQIRNTEAFKKAPKGGPKTSNNYPMSLKKNGFKVTVFNDQDFYEARSEGWA